MTTDVNPLKTVWDLIPLYRFSLLYLQKLKHRCRHTELPFHLFLQVVLHAKKMLWLGS